MPTVISNLPETISVIEALKHVASGVSWETVIMVYSFYV